MCVNCKRKPKDFQPTSWTRQQIKAVIPAALFQRNIRHALYYLGRDLLMTLSLGWGVCVVDKHFLVYARNEQLPQSLIIWLRTPIWMSYWWFQSLVFTGLWLIAHECVHGAFSASPALCDSFGFVIHTCLGTPYYSWKHTHNMHHRYNSHMNKDEHWIPQTRNFGPPASELDPPQSIGIWEIIEDTPVYQLTALAIQQIIGFQTYLLFNVSGQPYPHWTSHFNPGSLLFPKKHYWAVVLSDVGIFCMIYLLTTVRSSLGSASLFRIYLVPWVLMSHWISMIVFLQHSDPTLPHYRAGKWSFMRGAFATMDRDFLGWQGRFFLHDVAHYHLVHHFFPKIPFYNLQEATEHVKVLLGSEYNYCETPVFKALWENFIRCRYVNEEGDVVFYMDKRGVALHHDLYPVTIDSRETDAGI